MRLIVLCVVIAGSALPASAQDRPFLFVTTTSEQARPSTRFDYGVGIGERAFQSDIAHPTGDDGS